MYEKKLADMCRAAIGGTVNVKMANGAIRRGWRVVQCEFRDWQQRGKSDVARFDVIIENPPQYPRRVTDTVILTRLPR